MLASLAIYAGVFFIFYDVKLDIFGVWTVGDQIRIRINGVWEPVIDICYHMDQAINQLKNFL